MVSKTKQQNIAYWLKYLLSLVAIVFFLSIFRVSTAKAATLNLGASSKSVGIGQTFTVTVSVSTIEAMNASSGRVSFPADKLEALAANRSGSIMSLWVKEPTVTSSYVSFEGIVLNPGFVGSGGKIMTITFKAKAEGTAAITFSSGAVLANDGQGTSILDSLGSTQVTINPAPPTPTPEQLQEDLVITNLRSIYQPDPAKWYQNPNLRAEWTNPNSATGVSYALDRNPSTNPDSVAEGTANFYEKNGLENGIWYFHVKAKNAKGWGPPSHLKIQIDRGKPDWFTLTEITRTDKTDPVIQLKLEAYDGVSGIENFEITLPGNQSQTWKDDGSHIFKTSSLPHGTHTILAKALDFAGNYLAEFVPITIDPLKTPKLSSLPDTFDNTGTFKGSGTSEYANSKLHIYYQNALDEKPSDITIITDKNGNFEFILPENLKNGLYKLWAVVEDDRGATSEPGDFVNFTVTGEKLLDKNALQTIYTGAGIFIAIIIFIVLLLLILKLRKKFSRSNEEGTADAPKDVLNQVLAHVTENINFFKSKSKKNELNDTEKKVLNKLKRDQKTIKNFMDVDSLVTDED